MAINRIDAPGTTAPTGNTDYTQQNERTEAAVTSMAPDSFILTDLTSTTAAPSIKQGTFIRHAGDPYETQTSDETISGSPSSGMNWVKLTVSGSTLTASWVTTLSGYTYNQAYQGWYSGTDQILPQGVWLDGTTYNRFISQEKTNPYVVTLGDGRILSDDKRFISTATLVKIKGVDTEGSDIDTGGGDIDTNGGRIDTFGGDIATDGGIIDTDGGDILARTGSFQAKSAEIGTTGTGVPRWVLDTPKIRVEYATGAGGTFYFDIMNVVVPSTGETDITTNGGDIDTDGGSITAGGGDILSEGGNIRTTSGFLGTKTVSSVPLSGDGQNGDIVGYDDGTNQRIYIKLNGTWRNIAII